MSSRNNIPHIKEDYTFKILFLGNAGVGKTSIIYRYVDDVFKNSLKSTIGIDYKAKIIEYKSKKIKLMIFDTGGQERFHALTKNYYQRADGIIMVFDTKNKQSFEGLTYWMKEVNQNFNKNNIGLLLVGNKIDGEESEREIKKEDAIAISNIYEFKYIETSALANENINDCFDILVHSIFDKRGIKFDDNNNGVVNTNKDKNFNILLENDKNNNDNNGNKNKHNCC